MIMTVKGVERDRGIWNVSRGPVTGPGAVVSVVSRSKTEMRGWQQRC